MKTYEYLAITLTGQNDIENDVTNKLNKLLAKGGKHEGFKVHSVTHQSHDNAKNYWISFLLEKEVVQ